MRDAVCGECSKLILSGDRKLTVQQVDASTKAVRDTVYHAACWDQRKARDG